MLTILNAAMFEQTNILSAMSEANTQRIENRDKERVKIVI